jgi:cyclohexanone monooxygenase
MAHSNKLEMTSTENFDAIVVGAGFAGMYMLHRLRGMGLSVRVYERGDGVGGTWYWNRYPGARCDLESMEYSYSFDKDLEQEWNWAEKYGTQPELLKYANHVADRFDLRRDIVFETRVDSAHQDQSSGLWRITTDQGAVVTATHLILATGNLSTPQLPKIDGVEGFQGRTFHTGQWPHDGVDFTGRRVGVIGTGSSAVQAIPKIAEQADHLTVFQRTANFSIPARHGPLAVEDREAQKARYGEIREAAYQTPFGIAKYGSPTQSAFDVSDVERQKTYEQAWALGGQALLFTYTDLLLDNKAYDTAAEFVRERIRETVKDPEVAELLCPKDHPIGTKRLCLDSFYYETYNRENVSLINVKQTPISRIEAHAVVVDSEIYEIDDLVLATGFDAMTGAARDIDIRNENGNSLAESWVAGPQTYLGLMVSEFPNMYLITGPQSPGVKSQMILSIEHHVDLIAELIDKMRTDGSRKVVPAAPAQDAWVSENNKVAHMTLYPAAASWYMGANIPGKPRVFMPYVAGVKQYRQTCAEIIEDNWRGFEFSQ